MGFRVCKECGKGEMIRECKNQSEFCQVCQKRIYHIGYIKRPEIKIRRKEYLKKRKDDLVKT